MIRKTILIALECLGVGHIGWTAARAQEHTAVFHALTVPKFSPFYVSANELRCSEDIPQQFHLFRVFDLSPAPRLYILHGSLRELCRLDPVLYREAI
jgi:hypothetical protein